MPRVINLRGGQPLFDISSYAKRGPGRRDHLSPADIAQIERTVRRDPEVVIKVLNHGEQNLGAIQRHLDYIGRKGELGIETDEGEQLQGKAIGKDLLEDWDLDLEVARRRAALSAINGRKPPKLVHKLMFSMPPGTPPDKLLAAVRNFAREEFGLKHRYAMVLHTDEPHPHVHMVVKAMSEQGVRLNIRKATLREWRREFARHLRAQGVPANATERAVRGQSRGHKRDGIYRAALRGVSTHMRDRVELVAAEIGKGNLRTELGKAKAMLTREEVERGWRAATEILVRQGQAELARQVERFLAAMPPPRSEQEWLAESLLAKVRLPPTHTHS